MKILPKFLCVITLLIVTVPGWASCPEGYEENDRTGECKAIPGVAEKVEAKKDSKEHKQKIKEILASLSPGTFVKYADASWVTVPMNTEEAIEFYFKGRQLDPIEGIWTHRSGSRDVAFAIVKNTFGLPKYMSYVGFSTTEKSPLELDPYAVEKYSVLSGRGVVNYYWAKSHNPYNFKSRAIQLTGETSTGFFSSKLYYQWNLSPSPQELSSDGQILTELEHYITSTFKSPEHVRYVKLYPDPDSEPEQQVAGSGTGFFVSSDGYVVTNHHVIEGANKITVTTPSGESFDAKVVSTSTSTDLAVLRIPYQTKNYLTFANPSSTDIGHQVFTLGYPVSDILGKEVKYTDGSISSLSGIQGDATFFQISVPIQPGNSGGPLVNADGDVVGVVTATAAVEAFYASVGVMPQNVNWAVKGAYASLLLPPTMEMNERPKSNPIANAKWSVVFIETE